MDTNPTLVNPPDSSRPLQEPRLPQIDKYRLDLVTFVYAAALGIGYSSWEGSPWLRKDSLGFCDDWYCHLPALYLFASVFVMIAVDWLFIPKQYLADGAYHWSDFLLDMLIVFFFVRMMQEFRHADGVFVTFRYWLWLGCVFFLYFIWDWVRIRNAWKHSPKLWPASMLQAIYSQRLSLSADVLMATFCLAYYCSVGFGIGNDSFGTTVLVVLTPCFFFACHRCWEVDRKRGKRSGAD